MTETIWHQQTIDSYLQALGEANTDPAGGAQAALLGAQACAMASMVVRFTLSNKKYAPLHERARVWLDGLAASQKTLLNLMQEDVRALNAMSHTWSIPKDDPTRPAKSRKPLYGVPKCHVRWLKLSSPSSLSLKNSCRAEIRICSLTP